MVVLLKHKKIPLFLQEMKRKFDKYDLIFNPLKSAITTIRNHCKTIFNEH